MARRIADIEYEQMLLSRYTTAQHRLADGLDRSAYLLLSRIDADGPKSIGELSEIFRLDASTLQRQTGSAVAAGLLQRVIGQDGGVARQFALTELGRERLVRAREVLVGALGAILGGWSDDDVATFADLLHRFNLDIESFSASVPR